jgi:hypothetical protein
MARVIEFYVPGNSRKPWRSAPQLQSGKVIEFRSPTSRSAELTHPLSGSLAGLGIGMKPGRLVLTEEHDNLTRAEHSVLLSAPRQGGGLEGDRP